MCWTFGPQCGNIGTGETLTQLLAYASIPDPLELDPKAMFQRTTREGCRHSKNQGTGLKWFGKGFL